MGQNSAGPYQAGAAFSGQLAGHFWTGPLSGCVERAPRRQIVDSPGVRSTASLKTADELEIGRACKSLECQGTPDIPDVGGVFRIQYGTTCITICDITPPGPCDSWSSAGSFSSLS